MPDIDYETVYKYLESIDFSFYSIYEFEIIMRILGGLLPGFRYYRVDELSKDHVITMRLVCDNHDDIDIKIK